MSYNYKKREMRQDHKLSHVENGALYIFETKNLLHSKNRLHKKIGTYIMPKNRSLEIDGSADLKKLK